MRAFNVVLTFFVAIPAIALTEIVNPRAGNDSHAPAMPNCVNDEKELAAIKNQMQDYAEKKKKNKGAKTDADKTSKYSEMKRALQTDSDEQLMARLVYSEVKAAHCPEFDSLTAGPIAAVIKNRVRKHNDDVRSVVFEEDQFASSLNIYDIPASGDKPAAVSN